VSLASKAKTGNLSTKSVQLLSGSIETLARDGWNNFLENLQPLGADVRTKDAVAGDISSRSGEAWHEACAHGIADEIMTEGIVGVALLRCEDAGVP